MIRECTEKSSHKSVEPKWSKKKQAEKMPKKSESGEEYNKTCSKSRKDKKREGITRRILKD